MLKKFAWLGGALVLAVTAATTAQAAVSAGEAAKLKTTLTPIGAERAGNAAGTIPEWTGGLTKSPFPSYKPGNHHPDPYVSDKYKFVITAQNMSQYADNLSDGQKALFRTYPDTFKMFVYQTRRSAALPQRLYDNTFKCATTGVVKDWGIDGCIGGTPFPIPSGNNEEQALQILWNHITRYRGEYVVRKASEVAVQRNGSFSLVTSQQEVSFRNYQQQYKTLADLNNILFYYLSFTTAPARLAGGAVLVHETLDQRKQQRQAWGYNAGQRRVRQAPNLSYDTPIASSDGLRTADDTDMFNGAPDKYDWKFLGKKEIYIPYNNFKVDHNSITYKQLLQPGHPHPGYLRYELHRVWVIEGTLKSGERHIYSKRRFYIDEDSWNIAIADQYDGRGDLWRVSIAYLKNFYEMPLIWTALDVFHDLQARRYHVQQLDNEEDKIVNFQTPPSDEAFTPAALRRRGTR